MLRLRAARERQGRPLEPVGALCWTPGSGPVPTRARLAAAERGWRTASSWGIGVAVAGLILVGSFQVISFRSVGSLLVRKRGDAYRRLSWVDCGPTPLAERRYTPLGMTWADGHIFFANSWKNARSRVYRIEPAGMQVKGYFDMPDEAVHTSGLAWDGRHLWAVDFVSNRVYALDPEASLAAGRASVVHSFSSTLAGTSACCVVPWDGKQLLAISDFRRSRKTLFVDAERAAATGSAAGCVVLEYENEGFSQGLECFGGFLFESENKLGKNVINKIDLAVLRATRRARTATIMQYEGPSWGIEDLAWDGEHLWTSDETTFRFYKARLG